MDLEAEMKLSYYKEIADVNKAHHVKLVQHQETEKIYVQKALNHYDPQVFFYLSENSPKGTPKIFELINKDNCLYVIEEYITGDSLKELLDFQGPFAEKDAITMIKQLCSILKPLHAHHPSIVHRDIKPTNLIVKPDGTLTLIDFDSAKETKGNLCKDTVLIGTAGYAAPEQYGFYESMQTTDIYGIGILLHELLTGQLPNQGPVEVGSLSTVIKKCIHMDPNQRYQTVAELEMALKKPKVKKERNRPNKSGFRAWLPPGFRSGNPGIMVVGFLWYLLFFSLSLSLDIKNVNLIGLWVNRIGCLGIFFLETLFIGNYRDIWRLFPLTRSNRIVIKIVGVVLGAVLIFFVVIFLLVALLMIVNQ